MHMTIMMLTLRGSIVKQRKDHSIFISTKEAMFSPIYWLVDLSAE